MSTTLRIGPQDHGRVLSLEEFLTGDYEAGYKYELIDGRLYVSPEPNLPHEWYQDYTARPVAGTKRV